MKTCTLCKINKSKELFNKKTKSPDGLNSWCKDCKSIKDSKYYNKNPDKIRERANLRYINNKKDILASRDKERVKEYNSFYKEQKKEEIAIYNREYKQTPEYKEQRKANRKTKEAKEKNNASRKKWIANNPEIKVAISVRKRLSELLNLKGFNKTNKFEQYIGCTLDELKIHIESQFKDGMTWENQGSFWNLDHILALSNAQNEQQVYELSHYLNLRPLTKELNLIKSDRSDICWQKLQRDKLIKEDKDAGYLFNLTVSDFIFTRELFSLEHKQFIERYEWLGTVGFSPHYIFTARHNNKLAGIVIMGKPNLVQFDEKREILIQRGACSSWAPKNLNSSLIMFSCNWIVRNTEKRIFVAYSDPMAGEIGTIYQACNFDYLGNTFGAKSEYKLPDGKLVNRRYFMRVNNLKKYAFILNIKWDDNWKKYVDIPLDIKITLVNYAKLELKKYPRIKSKPKSKYVLLLNYGKDKVKKTWIPQPYPKRVIL